MGDMHDCNLGSCGLHAANDTIASLPRLFTDLVLDPIDSSQIPDKVNFHCSCRIVQIYIQKLI